MTTRTTRADPDNVHQRHLDFSLVDLSLKVDSKSDCATHVYRIRSPARGRRLMSQLVQVRLGILVLAQDSLIFQLRSPLLNMRQETYPVSRRILSAGLCLVPMDIDIHCPLSLALLHRLRPPKDQLLDKLLHTMTLSLDLEG